MYSEKWIIKSFFAYIQYHRRAPGLSLDNLPELYKLYSVAMNTGRNTLVKEAKEKINRMIHQKTDTTTSWTASNSIQKDTILGDIDNFNEFLTGLTGLVPLTERNPQLEFKM
jgi:hypothetical protein